MISPPLLWLVLALAPFQFPALVGGGDAPIVGQFVSQGGRALLDLRVDIEGRVEAVEVLEGPDAFVSDLVQAARRWRFSPTRVGGQAVPGRVGVVALSRPPAIFPVASVLEGVDPGSLDARDRAALPLRMTDPGYPPASVAEGVVVLELGIDASGAVVDRRVVRDVPSLGEPALEAVGSWRFAPARRGGDSVYGTVVVLISFLRPVVVDPD